MGRWEAETPSGGRTKKKSEKTVGGIGEEEDGEEGTQRGSQAHTTKQQTEGTECKSAATNKHRALARGDSAVSVILV